MKSSISSSSSSSAVFAVEDFFEVLVSLELPLSLLGRTSALIKLLRVKSRPSTFFTGDEKSNLVRNGIHFLIIKGSMRETTKERHASFLLGKSGNKY